MRLPPPAAFRIRRIRTAGSAPSTPHELAPGAGAAALLLRARARRVPRGGRRRPRARRPLPSPRRAPRRTAGAWKATAIRCPFHGWKWAGDGRCLEVPYAKRIPPRRRDPRLAGPSSATGSCGSGTTRSGSPPRFEVPELPEVGSPDWTPLEIRRWTVKSRWLDMNENSVDQAHFQFVHGTRTMPAHRGDDRRPRPALPLAHEAGRRRGARSRAASTPTTTARRSRPCASAGIVADVDGEHRGADRRRDHRRQLRLHRVQPGATRRRRGASAPRIIRDLEKQMSQDIPIWENKAYWERPVLCDGDGPIGVYRRWMRQFFDEAW